MARRLPALLALALYALPQIGVWAHVEDEPEVCRDCETTGPAVQCDASDCQEPGHHHHSSHHHPGNCRLCSSAAHLALAPFENPVDLTISSAFSTCTLVVPESADRPWRPIRGPPGPA